MAKKRNISSALWWIVTPALLFCCALPLRAEELAEKKEYPSQIPDTGQRHCYDTKHVIDCPNPGEPFYGQDANYSINAPDYSFTGEGEDGIVNDQVTGLSWQRSPDTLARNWSDAIDYANDLQLSEFDDWRIPTKQELHSILSFGDTPGPLEKPSPQTEASGAGTGRMYAWTLSNLSFPSLVAKSISLTDNQGAVSSKNNKYFVYGVRGASLTHGLFRDNEDETVTDQETGLMWQATEIRPKNWEQALAYCEGLQLGGFDDWRLPTIRELMTLVNEGQADPAIDRIFFPGARSAPYWTGTTFSGHPGFAWYVRFYNGLEYNGGYKERHYFVRAVRGGVIAAAPPEAPVIPRAARPTLQKKIKRLRRPKIDRLKLPTEDEMDILQPAPLDYKLYEE